ncbi:uncharacterized protein K460DRAFT_283339 [Cucurbitaria berberidis CBS 394.84]|uniref:Amidohydrolase-related domain-containing protein n=1 Tax=Cucurbitaria berberidis CBS 394.84 TaxID=1168544 RepID=A0A9P4GIJ6_9PLEO|nr:uncharacterized protein K460DRAFT_283339 [Cucurbitaria berberidis CBS 394.84]KAF1846240.1 hypothetical protein K460DRAFT_283339 [Cucurbitaria berberidis CBS 394.84]
MEKHVGAGEGLPTYAAATTLSTPRPWHNRRKKRRTYRLLALACFASLAYYTLKIANNTTKPINTLSIKRLQDEYAACSTLRSKPATTSGTRDFNKRWTNTTKPLLIRNATIWTGEPAPGTSDEDARAGKGWSWLSSDIFVDRGLIWNIASRIDLKTLPHDTDIFDAKGRQVTAGIVDMHSHAGLGSVGNLEDDSNELSSDITPYVRSIDGIDPLQPEIEFIKSGGVTTSLILPGSGNNIGGEAFVLKFAVGTKNGRLEVSQQDMFADPDKTWRYMKMACGENAKFVYGKQGERGPFSRLGEAWQFRHAFEQATKYVQEQDEWCAAADALGMENMATHLRQELEFESLGAVLRGQVKVNTHCYTVADLEAFVRHTNEFKFRVYAFHHAHQTFLVPEVLKRAWGGTPAAALFADNMYYKVEAYTASERAGALLYAHNITPTYVSDNPVLNSQHVVFEAAKAYRNGLPYHAALGSVTSAPAELLGLGHRIGKIRLGFDADLVVWDSDPLSVGGTPVQVWIDGAKQFDNPIELKKPVQLPAVPDVELAKALEKSDVEGSVILTGISNVHHSAYLDPTQADRSVVAIISNGTITCVGLCESEITILKSNTESLKTIDLKNGYFTAPFTAFGTALGLQEIDAMTDTHDGLPPADGITFALEGISFGGKQLAAAFDHGVTKAISAPSLGGIDSKGVSVGFHTGANNRLEEGAIWNAEVALHYQLTPGVKNDKTTSISKAIGDLIAKLLDAVDELRKNKTADVPSKEKFQESAYLKRVVQGDIPLVLSAHSADTIASIIRSKAYIESAIAESPISTTSPTKKLRIVIIGGAEAHLVANEVAAADIPIVLAPLLPHAQSWDQRRGLTGPPLTNVSTNILLDAGVLLGICVEETWESRDLGLLAGIAFANSEGRLSEREALDLVGANFDRILDITRKESVEKSDWVVWEGSPLEIGGRVRAIGGLGKTSVWE